VDLDIRELADPLSWGRRALREISSVESGSTSVEGCLIVLVGKSQVGKTTLAMRLLGASPKEAGALSGKLRGGSLVGDSGTPSTSLYVATGRLRDPKAWENHLSGLEKQANRVRNGLTDRSVDSVETYNICVDGGLAASIVDTEGLEPRNESERERSLEAVKKWLNRADFALYVSSADLIQDLSPSNRSLDPAYDLLRSSPRHCVVALTSAYELPTISDCLADCGSPEELLEKATDHYRSVLLKDVFPGIEADAMPLVVPLSLKALEHDSKNKAKAAKATDLALEQVRGIFDDDINRIRMGFTLSQLYMQRVSELENAGRTQVESAERCYSEHRIRLRDLLLQRRDLARKSVEAGNSLKDDAIAGEIHSVLRSLLKSVSNGIESQSYNRPEYLKRHFYEEMILTGLSDSIGDLADITKACLDSWRSSLADSMQDFLADEARSVARKIDEIASEAAEIDAHLRKSLIKKNWLRGVKEEESIGRASALYSARKRSLIADIACIIREGFSTPLQRWGEAKKRVLARRAQSLQSRMTTLETTALETSRHMKAARLEADRASLALESSIARCRNLMKKANDYGNRLASEYKLQWNSLVEIGNRAPSPEEKLFIVAVLFGMHQNLERLSEWDHPGKTG
jgi:hypothetical protein